jgi:hypothetical protein
LPWHSVFGRRIDPRERRTLAIAALVSVTALVTAYGIVPFVRRWNAREAAIAAKQEQLARLTWLARNEATLTQMALEREAALDASPRRLLVAESANLAAAELQRELLEYAESSQLDVQQVDVAGDGRPAATGRESGARLSAIGDIVGLGEFLARLARGGTYLHIEELDVQPNAARGDLLGISVAVRAPFVQP